MSASRSPSLSPEGSDRGLRRRSSGNNTSDQKQPGRRSTNENRESIPYAGEERLGTKYWGQSRMVPPVPERRPSEENRQFGLQMPQPPAAAAFPQDQKESRRDEHDQEHDETDSDDTLAKGSDDGSPSPKPEERLCRKCQEPESCCSRCGSEIDQKQKPHGSNSKDSNDAEKGKKKSKKDRDLVKVPRKKRRGFFGAVTLVPEVEKPTEYRNSTKWMMTCMVALAAGTSATGSSIFYPALHQVSDELHTSSTIVNLSLAFYLLAMAFTPMWWSAWSETLGRRSIYILSFFFFVVFSVCSAVSVNIGMLIAFRILSGGAAAAVQAVGAGTVADLWEPAERGSAMGIFYLGPLCGPGIAPIIGGALAQTLGWESTLWALAIFGGVMLLLIIFCLPETVARRPPPTDMKWTAKLARNTIDPIKTLKLLQHPPILITVYCGGMAFASLYVINVAVQANFEAAPYNFSTIIVGLLYIPPTLGYAVASQTGGRWIDYLMKRGARHAGRYDSEGKPIYLPEDRMQENIWLAASLYPGAMIWYGWTADYGIHWIVPCIANFFFGIGSMLVFGAVTTMLTEFTPKRSSTGVALNNFVRQILATIATIVVQPLIGAMGTGWMCTMIALFAWTTGNLAIFLLKKKGPEWREKMDKKLNKPKPESEK